MRTSLKFLCYTATGLLLLTLSSCSKKDDGDGGDNKTPQYVTHEGHSYLVVKEKKNWVAAATDAVARGGYLVEIGSAAEQQVVYNAIKEYVSASYTTVKDGGGIAYVWIGATDREQEGTWLWNGSNLVGSGTHFWSGTGSGQAVGDNYYNWGGKAAGSTNEPDNFTDATVSPNGQDAAAIGLANWPAGATGNGQLGRAGEWNDIAETNLLYYVIEFDTIKE